MTLPYGKHSLNEKDIQAVIETLGSDRITQGPRVPQFEQALCEHFGCDHAVVVSSGTTALQLAYRALGVGEGDVVWTTPNTFVATAHAVVHNGGVPKLADIEPDTYNLSVKELRSALENTGGEDAVGIAPVHFAGNPCRMEAIQEIAREHGLFVLEDASHAPGAEWTDSRGRTHAVGSCSHSDAAVLSFHPVKHFTTGEGGAVLTNRGEVAKRVRRLRTHGVVREPEPMKHSPDGPWYYEVHSLGLNGRITDFQCALGLKQLEKLDGWVKTRRRLARRYTNQLMDTPGVKVPSVPPDDKHAYHLYVILADQRDRLYEHLHARDIAVQVHYVPLHHHPFYQERYGYERGDFPQVEKYYERALSLPLFPELQEQQQNRVTKTIKSFYQSSS